LVVWERRARREKRERKKRREKRERRERRARRDNREREERREKRERREREKERRGGGEENLERTTIVVSESGISSSEGIRVYCLFQGNNFPWIPYLRSWLSYTGVFKKKSRSLQVRKVKKKPTRKKSRKKMLTGSSIFRLWLIATWISCKS
jgi:hypothetical protein